MTIYTRTGDQGQSDLLGGVCVPKDSAVLEFCGELDELNAWLGLVRCETLPKGAADVLERAQRRLFDIGGEAVVAASGQSAAGAIGPPEVAALEQMIDQYETALPELGTFVLPGGSRTAALLHLARTVCRRAERRLVALLRTRPQAASPNALAYINRLSDLLFVMARAANGHAGVLDIPC